MTDYQPSKVWTWNKENGGQFAAINRPVAGATHDKQLPVGRDPLQLYSLATPNGVKVTILLEELLALGLAGAEYDAWLISIRDGDLRRRRRFSRTKSYTNLVRWAEEIAERPAVKRGRVNRVTGPEDEQLAERHEATDFDYPTRLAPSVHPVTLLHHERRIQTIATSSGAKRVITGLCRESN